jgi:hypothetical protein
LVTLSLAISHWPFRRSPGKGGALVFGQWEFDVGVETFSQKVTKETKRLVLACAKFQAASAFAFDERNTSSALLPSFSSVKV